EPPRRGACDLLLPSVGGRSRAAAGSRHRCAHAISALPQPRAHAGAVGAPLARLRVGSRRRGIPAFAHARGSRRMMSEAAVVERAAPPRAASALRVATLARGDAAGAARWDAFVMGSKAATFFHRAGWLDIVAGVFGHAPNFLYAERDGAIVGVLPLARN